MVSPHLRLPPVQSTDREVVVPEYPPNPTAVRTNIPIKRMMVITALHDRVATMSASIIPQFVSVSPPVSRTAVTSSPLSRRFFDIVPRFEFTGRLCRVWRSTQKPGLAATLEFGTPPRFFVWVVERFDQLAPNQPSVEGVTDHTYPHPHPLSLHTPDLASQTNPRSIFSIHQQDSLLT